MPESVKCPSSLLSCAHRALALVDHDVHGRLIVFGGRENLTLGGRDRGVPRNERGHDAAEGFNAEGERGDIQEHDVFDFAGDDAALDGGSDRHGLIGLTERLMACPETCLTRSCTAGMRMEPPIMRISPKSEY